MAEPHELSATEAARRIRAGTLSPVELIRSCLERIAVAEPTVRAWVHLDGEAALAAARAREAEAGRGRFAGPLHGIPVALKDIFDAAGLPTTAGAGPFAHRRPATDATAVARLRAAGAIVLGKVTTTAFAYLDPSPTRNPWNPDHTPGGSSSGPAAAVAARMVPLALGSQTVGSVLRPAAYCGVIGFKPTHGRISAAGVVPLAWSHDHVGTFTRTVEDAALALGVLAGFDPADPLCRQVPVEDYVGAVNGTTPPRLGFVRSLLERATPDMAAHVARTADRLRAAGGALADVSLPPSFARIHEAGATVTRAEAAAYHRPLFARHADEYPPKIREAIELGQRIPAVDFVLAQGERRRFQEEMAELAAAHDAILLPTVGAPAPRGLGSTGDPWFCAPWSFAGMPAVSLPSGISADGLPLSVQLVASVLAEDRLLAAAAWCERAIGFGDARRP